MGICDTDVSQQSIFLWVVSEWAFHKTKLMFGSGGSCVYFSHAFKQRTGFYFSHRVQRSNTCIFQNEALRTLFFGCF